MSLATNKQIKEAQIIIGIDPGVNTGYAIYDRKEKQLRVVTSLMVHEAFLDIQQLISNGIKLFVRFEDARKRKFFGTSGREKLQGAGSVKRDSKIWEDYLTHYEIPFEALSPLQKGRKVDAKMFTAITSYNGKTNEHGRDAAMLCYKV